MEEATVVEYCVKIGDRVAKGDCLFEIETDKAAVEVESPADGFVRHIFAGPGRTLPVGQAVLVLGGKDEKIPQGLIDTLRGQYIAAASDERRATSDERRGEASLETAQTPPIPQQIKLGSTVALTRLQKITAEKMTRSKRTKPCFYLTVRADVTELVRMREKLSETADVKISYNDFIIKAVAVSLQKFPIMAGRLVEDKIQLPDTVNVALAVAVGDNVVAPVIKDVQRKNVAQIALDSAVLIEKARANKLAPAELEDACITLSNLGRFGVDSFIPIVIPGQCSILGVGAVIDTAIAENGSFAVRKIMSLTLSADHRITNGAYAAGFLDFLRKTLEDASNFT